MDQLSQENLQRILALPEHLLTVEDKRFLHARRPYLTKSQLNDYSDVIAEVESWNQELLDDDGNPIYNKDGKPTKKAAPKNPAPEQTEQVQQTQQPTQYQDKDTRLNLDQPNNDQTQQAQNNESTGNGSQEVECLDPDCTHENHQ